MTRAGVSEAFGLSSPVLSLQASAKETRPLWGSHHLTRLPFKARELVPQGKALAAKPGDLNLIPQDSRG